MQLQLFDLLFELIRDSSCLCIRLLLGDSSLQDFVNWLNMDAVRVGGGFELDASSDSVVQLNFWVTQTNCLLKYPPNTEQIFRRRALFDTTAALGTEITVRTEIWSKAYISSSDWTILCGDRFLLDRFFTAFVSTTDWLGSFSFSSLFASQNNCTWC